MTVEQLGERLRRESFRADVYSLDGSTPAYEGLVLSRESSRWKIKHYERGLCRELASFDDEEAACERMYQLLSTHFRW